tara:strand:+ start:671 stop:940 length:270 start_codon:yes stop_codon:yes gene_type:complete
MSFKKIATIIDSKIKEKIEHNISIKKIEEEISKMGVIQNEFSIVKLADKKITIKVKNPAARNEISFEKENIIKKINRNLKTNIKEARII